jgi:hypothetical protein
MCAGSEQDVNSPGARYVAHADKEDSLFRFADNHLGCFPGFLSALKSDYERCDESTT